MTSPFDPTSALEGALDIDSPAAFDALLESIEDNGLWILDTEFERTDTYYPRLALIQSAVAGQVSLLDPLILDGAQRARLRTLLERDDILNIGGFSDAVFNVVSAFLSDDANRFVAEVESIEL